MCICLLLPLIYVMFKTVYFIYIYFMKDCNVYEINTIANVHGIVTFEIRSVFL